MVGRDSLMRVASLTRSPSTGTLKSTRTKTRLFFTFKWSMDSLFKAAVSVGKVFSQEFQRFHHPAGEGPLVVVPGQNFHQVIADDGRGQRIENRGMRVADYIGGNNWINLVFEN